MRLLFLLWMLTISTSTFAQTILQVTLYKNSIVFNSPTCADEHESLFPCNNYNLSFMANLKLISTSEKDFNAEQYNTIGFEGNMQLLDYDKLNKHYKFRLSFKPHIWLMGAKEGLGMGVQQKEIKNPKIYFSATNMDSMIIEGNLNHEFLKRSIANSAQYEYLPRINERDSRPFIISRDISRGNPHGNDIYVTPQHDVLVTVIIDE